MKKSSSHTAPGRCVQISKTSPLLLKEKILKTTPPVKQKVLHTSSLSTFLFLAQFIFSSFSSRCSRASVGCLSHRTQMMKHRQAAPASLQLYLKVSTTSLIVVSICFFLRSPPGLITIRADFPKLMKRIIKTS